jgi:hypothetical protein
VDIEGTKNSIDDVKLLDLRFHIPIGKEFMVPLFLILLRRM